MINLKETFKLRGKSIAIISVFVVLAAFIVATTHYGTKTLSAVRAYVDGEGKWTKAQKRISHLLIEYSNTEEIEYYEQAQKQLRLHDGFQKARKALILPRRKKSWPQKVSKQRVFIPMT